MNKLDIVGRISFLVLIVLKSIWNATIHIVWGMATVLLLGGLILYFAVDTTPITTLLEITIFIMDNWVLFWWVFFTTEFYPQLNKEYNKND